MAYGNMVPVFLANTADQLCEVVEGSLAARILKMPGSGTPLDARAHRVRLCASEIWHCSYGVPVTLRFPEADYIRVQIPRSGCGQSRIGDRRFPVAADRSCISAASADIDFGPDFRQLVWRIPTSDLVRKLSLLIGRPIVSKVEFDPDYDLSIPAARPFLRLLDCALDSAEPGGGAGLALQLAEIEEAMVTAFLRSGRHNHRALLDGPVPGAAPWQVARVEAYIEAHWDQPLRIDDLVAETGASARSIFRAFKRFRGYSPMDFAKRLRLENAMKRLSDRSSGRSVTDVALECGFGDLSRFSKDFLAAFGVRPSEVARRSRAS